MLGVTSRACAGASPHMGLSHLHITSFLTLAATLIKKALGICVYLLGEINDIIICLWWWGLFGNACNSCDLFFNIPDQSGFSILKNISHPQKIVY